MGFLHQVFPENIGPNYTLDGLDYVLGAPGLKCVVCIDRGNAVETDRVWKQSRRLHIRSGRNDSGRSHHPARFPRIQDGMAVSMVRK